MTVPTPTDPTPEEFADAFRVLYPEQYARIEAVLKGAKTRAIVLHLSMEAADQEDADG